MTLRTSKNGKGKSRGAQTLLPALFLLSIAAGAHGQADFIRADVNADGTVSLADAGAYGCILFCDPFPTGCEDAADINDDGIIQAVDMVVLLTYLFVGEGPSSMIPPPFPEPGPDPTDDLLTCESYEMVPARPTEALLRVGSVSAAPGDEVSLPIFLSHSEPVAGLQIVLSYDPDVFSPEPFTRDDRLRSVFADTVFEDSLASPSSAGTHYLELREFPEDGILEVGFLFHLLGLREAGPGEDIHVLNLLGTITADAEAGREVPLEFLDHETPTGETHNEITGADGVAGLVTRTVSGALTVAGGLVRGDANADGTVDISDSIDVLLSLFTSGGVLVCMDAADVNDDGAVDMSDPIRLLDFLFLGGVPLAAPSARCGTDPTEDTLDCWSYPPCS